MTDARRLEKQPTVIILGMGITGLGVIRNLGRKGVRIIGMDPNPLILGRFSRYSRGVISPDVEKCEDKFLESLLKTGKKIDAPGIIFPTEDRYVNFVSKNRDTLSRYFKFPLPGKILCDEILNKYKFFKLAEQSSFSVPLTFSAKTINDVRDAASKIAFPCIIKPLYSRKWKLGGMVKALKIDNKSGLLEKGAEFMNNDSEIVIQEMVSGMDSDQFSFAAYFDLHGNFRAGFVARKVRQHPLDFGVGTLVESLHEPEVAALGESILRKIGFRGIAEVEFRKDQRDGKLKLIEINLRPWTQNSLASICGLNIIHIAYLDLAGMPLPKDVSYKDGIKWINFFRDPVASFQYILRKEMTLAGWLKSLRGVRDLSVFAPDDILPFLFLPLYIADHFIRRKE